LTDLGAGYGGCGGKKSEKMDMEIRKTRWERRNAKKIGVGRIKIQVDNLKEKGEWDNE